MILRQFQSLLLLLVYYYYYYYYYYYFLKIVKYFHTFSTSKICKIFRKKLTVKNLNIVQIRNFGSNNRERGQMVAIVKNYCKVMCICVSLLDYSLDNIGRPCRNSTLKPHLPLSQSSRYRTQIWIRYKS